MKRIWCWLSGHKRWEFDGNPVLRIEGCVIHACRRCGTVWSETVEWEPSVPPEWIKTSD